MHLRASAGGYVTTNEPVRGHHPLPVPMDEADEAADESGMDTDHEVPCSSSSPARRSRQRPYPISSSTSSLTPLRSNAQVLAPTSPAPTFVEPPSYFFSLSGLRRDLPPATSPSPSFREVTFPPARKHGLASSASHHPPPLTFIPALSACPPQPIPIATTHLSRSSSHSQPETQPQPQPQPQHQSSQPSQPRPFAFPTTNPGSQFVFFSPPAQPAAPKPRQRTSRSRAKPASTGATPISSPRYDAGGASAQRRPKQSLIAPAANYPSQATFVAASHSSQGDLASSIKEASPATRRANTSAPTLPSTSCSSSFGSTFLTPLLSSLPRMRRWRGRADSPRRMDQEKDDEEVVEREPCLFEVPKLRLRRAKKSLASGETSESESEAEFPGSPLQLEESEEEGTQSMEMEKKAKEKQDNCWEHDHRHGKQNKKHSKKKDKEVDSTSDMSEGENTKGNTKKSKGSRVLLSRQLEGEWKKNKKNRVRSGETSLPRENSCASFSICPSCPCPINCVPGELLFKVLAQLDIPTLCSISCVCRHWHDITQAVFKTKIGIGKPPYFPFDAPYCAKGGGPLLFFNKPVECAQTQKRREAIMVLDPTRIPCEGPKKVLCIEGRFRALHRLDKHRVVFKLGVKCCALYIVNLKHALAKKLLPAAKHGVTFVKGRGCKVLVGAYRGEGYRANYKVQRNQHDDDYSVESAPDVAMDLYLIQTKTVHLDTVPVFEDVRHILPSTDNDDTNYIWFVNSEYELWRMSMDNPSCRECVLRFQTDWVLPLCTFVFSPSRQYLGVGVAERCHFKNVRHLKVYDLQSRTQIFELRDIPTRVCPMSSTPVTLAFVWVDDRQIQFSETRVTDTEKYFQWTVLDVISGERISETKYARIGLYHIACKGFDCLINKRKRNGMFEVEWPNIYYLGEKEPFASLVDACGGVLSSELSVSPSEGTWVAYLHRLEACQWGAFVVDARTRSKAQIESEWCYNFHWV